MTIVVARGEEVLGGETGAAWFSQDRAYRYALTRTWDMGAPVMTWIGLNPSTASAMTIHSMGPSDPKNIATGKGIGSPFTPSCYGRREIKTRRAKPVWTPP